MTASLAAHRQPQRTAAGRAEGRAVTSPAPRPLAPSPLPAAAPLQLVPRPEGLLQVHTAPFRGSVAAVFSQALRSAGLGSRVLVSQFLKGGVDQGRAGSLQLCGRLEWLRPATPLCIQEPLATARDPEEAAAAQQAVLEVWHYSCERLLDGSVDLLVLDELGLAVELGYLAGPEVSAALQQRPAHLDVILTGPSMPAELMAMADQVTQLRRCA
ncbi:MAG: cob(I)yrinic acid a,c-diamide adenosyltransferase [Cyanobium sp.]